MQHNDREAGALKTKIIYTTRTHQQLRHVLKELKALSPDCSFAYLGSRESLCLNP